MSFTNYLLEKLKRAKHHLFLIAKGGSGKTYTLIDTYRTLLKTPHFCCGKRIIPLYIPLSDIDNNVQECSLRSYIMHKYGGRDANEQGVDKEQYIAAMEQRIFSNTSSFFFCIILDAINEHGSGEKFLKEISIMSNYSNVSVTLTSRYELQALFLKADPWQKLHLNPLSNEIVVNALGEREEITPGKVSLLSSPFFLSKYVQLKEDEKLTGQELTGEFHLINAYCNWIKEKQILANQVVDKYAQELNRAYTQLLPLICLVLSYHREMVVDLTWQDQINRFKRNCGRNYLEEYMADDMTKENLQSIFETYFIPLGVFYKTGEYKYRVSHEIYRDFFTVVSIAFSVQNNENAMDLYTKNVSFQFNEDVMLMLANKLMNKPSFVDVDGTVLVTPDDMLAGLQMTNDAQITSHSFETYSIIAYNLLSRFMNGTPAKRAFCNHFLSISTVFYSLLNFDMTQYKKNNEVNDFLLEVFRIHAEILRRTNNYINSIEASKTLDSYAQGDNKEYSAVARNNVAKCSLYEAFDLAVDIKADKEKTAGYYQNAIEQLEKLSKEGHYESRNLLAMLLAYPDPVSDPYISAFLGKDAAERRERAFFLNYETGKMQLLNHPGRSEWLYPIQQCLCAILNGDISCTYTTPVFSYLPFDALLRQNKLTFEPYDDAKRTSTFLVAEKIFDFLFKFKPSPMIHCLYAKYLLYKDGLNCDMQKLGSALKSSAMIPLSKVIYSLLHVDNDVATIQAIDELLQRKIGSRSPDCFDVVYIQKDMQIMWTLLCQMDYSPAYKNAVDALLTRNLKEA